MPDDRFPAWLIDTAIATAVADRLVSAMAAAIVPLRLVRMFRRWARRTYFGSQPNRSEIAAWLAGLEKMNPAIAPVVGQAFRDAYAQGWAAGRDTAEYLLDGTPGGTPDWSFIPGDADSAREILHKLGDDGPRHLYEQDGRPFMRGAVAGRIERIAGALHDGTAAGDSPQALAGRVRDTLDDRAWAHSLSVTEVSRAVNAATLDSYARDRVPASQWLTALDQRVCELCRDNERAGPVDLGEAFPSGDIQPPGHPGGCRCGLLPAYRDRHED